MIKLETLFFIIFETYFRWASNWWKPFRNGMAINLWIRQRRDASISRSVLPNQRQAWGHQPFALQYQPDGYSEYEQKVHFWVFHRRREYTPAPFFEIPTGIYRAILQLLQVYGLNDLPSLRRICRALLSDHAYICQYHCDNTIERGPGLSWRHWYSSE